VGLIKATWNGPYDAIIVEGGAPVKVGDEVEIPEEQALGGHWLVNGERLGDQPEPPADAIVEPPAEPEASADVEPEDFAHDAAHIDTGEEPV
jgi:hypothetical protein